MNGDNLASFGDAGPRLYSELPEPTDAISQHEGTTITDAEGDRIKASFQGPVGLLFDLQMGLKRAKIREPKPVEPPKFKRDLMQ